MPQPNTNFDWNIYADATFAGLSVLIPIIGIDWIFEEYFRRRIPESIVKHRRQSLPPEIMAVLKKNPERMNCAATCLLLPFIVIFWGIKRLSRKILYILTIKESAEHVSYHWQQAFLFDYSLQAGHLHTVESATAARKAIEAVVETGSTDSFYQLAWHITTRVKHVLRTLRKAWRGDQDEIIDKTRQEMRQGWSHFADDLEALAEKYAQMYQTIRAGKEPPANRSIEEKNDDTTSID